MTYHGILADMEALEDAVEVLPTRCLYHEEKIEYDLLSHAGPIDSDSYDGACCATGKPALYRRRAEAALERLRENL